MLLKKRIFAIAIFTIIIASNVNAAGFTNSYNSASGAGSAFAGASAIAEDASTVYFNPAGLSKLKGNEVVVAGHYVSPSADFTNNGSTTFGGGTLFGSNDDPTDPAFIPNLYYANKLNDKWTFGLGITIPFGTSTEYSDTWVGRYHATKTEITALNINPSASFKVSDKLSVGMGVNVQYVEANIANQIDSTAVCLAGGGGAGCALAGLVAVGDVATDSSVSLSADDLSLGWNLGLLYGVSKTTRLGAAYRSNIKHSLTGTADFTRSAQLNAALGASSLFTDTGASAELDLPESLSISLLHDFSSKWRLLADVTWTKWSRYDTLVATYDNAQPDTILPQNWDDSFRYSLGVNYQANAKWVYRAGLAIDESVVSSATYRTPRSPDTDRTWLSLGFGYKLSNTSSVDVGYTHIFFDDSPINNTDPSFGHTLTGSYDISADIFSAQFNWDF